ncbi:MAG: glycosyltransferase family 1 protein [Lentimicrobium sp.]|jgi:glycosyltransferase involved in cell wall biosynthesis|nr:glycosyltransferase family 1 protein [Lentimicrobium sp.]
MKIGYYISKIQASDGGIYQYSIYILKMLLQSTQVEKVYLFYSADQTETFEAFLKHPKTVAILHDKKSWLYNQRKRLTEFFLTRYYLKDRRFNIAYKLFFHLDPNRSFLNKFELDVLHAPRQQAPSYNLKFPVIISMHDLQQLHFPEFFTPLQRIYRSITYYTSLSEASHVIVSYNHVKEDIHKYFSDIPPAVSVCSVPMNEDWTESKSHTDTDVLKQKFALPDIFILTPAATWVHKNHLAVLEALSILKKKGRKVFWVSTGYQTNYYKTIESKITELGLTDQVLFTGLVSDADLMGLFKMASLVLIPTLYEAGSGPLFEAIRYQVPVICSNVTSLPDTIKNDEFVFDPLNYDQIAGLIEKALSDPSFVERNKQNSARRVTEFIHADYESSFMKAYRDAIDFHKHNPSKS